MSQFSASIRSIKGASITEFRPISDKMAKVISTVVGDMKPAELVERLTAALEGKASPIRGSFRWLEKGRSMIGFVGLVPMVRAYEEKNIEATYRRITANTFMDKNDESIWEVKPGSGGSYLAKKSVDNLAELIEANRVSPRGSMVRMYQVVNAAVRSNEFLAYVDGTNHQVQYGFCLENVEGGHKVLSHTTSEVENVPFDNVVAAFEVDVPKAIQAAVGEYDKKKSIDYYKRLYFYDPAYLEKTIRQVEEMAAA